MTGNSQATDEDLRLPIVHLVVTFVTKLPDTKIIVSFSRTESSVSCWRTSL